MVRKKDFLTQNNFFPIIKTIDYNGFQIRSLLYMYAWTGVKSKDIAIKIVAHKKILQPSSINLSKL